MLSANLSRGVTSYFSARTKAFNAAIVIVFSEAVSYYSGGFWRPKANVLNGFVGRTMGDTLAGSAAASG